MLSRAAFIALMGVEIIPGAERGPIASLRWTSAVNISRSVSATILERTLTKLVLVWRRVTTVTHTSNGIFKTRVLLGHPLPSQHLRKV